MSALDNISISNLGVDKATLRRIMAEAIWEWYRENLDDVIYEKPVKVWKFGFTVKIRIRDLRPLIERIAGPEP